MREPDFDVDGWSLDDGEELHREFPETFWIPDRTERETLQAGDFAKLIFRISIADPDDPVCVERMWVIVREKTSGGYLGILDNEPTSIAENDSFWVGAELPFSARHVIDVTKGDEDSTALAVQEPMRRWSRD